MPDDSMRTVLVALGSGLGVALAKVLVAVFTGSSAMAAEAAHSLGDSANDLFLFVAQRRSTRRPDDRHPLGYGREAYFWALIAALGVFVAGAAFARLDIADDLSGTQVKSLIRGIESGMKGESEAVYRVDVVPIGRVSSSSRNTNDS
jgi:divalent metal cation (Fe/Co/Zn/Cd) transporter